MMQKWARALYSPCLPLGDNRSLITGSERHIELSRRAACEGTVLLKNEGLLPFEKGTKLAIFGKAQIDYVKGGGGSGFVYAPYTRNIYEGLKMKSGVEVFDALSLYYKEYAQEQYNAGKKIGLFDEAPVPMNLLEKAKKFTDTAIITICRYSTENEDRRNDGTDNYFYLSEAEQAMVEQVTESFANVVVLLNVGAMIDTSWFAYNDKISAAVMLWQGGMEGGLAAADILVGDENPSGKLVDTCAKSFEDYPSSEGFHESPDYVKYTEDIFVGYRYFETIPGKKEAVVYPFGYGLSYTTFALSNEGAYLVGQEILVSVTVTNTGKIPGKEVVQAYYSAPAGKLDKPARELCGFAKTKVLEPGESEVLQIRFSPKDMASFDDTGKIAASAFVMEKGSYKFYVGTDVRSAKPLEFTYELSETIVTEQCHPYVAPEKLEMRLKADGTYELLLEQNEDGTFVYKNVTRTQFPCTYVCAAKPQAENEEEEDTEAANLGAEKTKKEEVVYTLMDVAEGKLSLDSFMAQLTDEELIHLVGGQPNLGVANTKGMGKIERLGIPEVMTVDGPAGVRIYPKTGIYTTAFPVATALACTWNPALLEEIGVAGALETKENNLQIWLTPALNIHRSPLCGRNFEYYSEDPFVAGKMAAAMVRGIQSQNIVAVPKHFACNNKETNRKESDSVVSQRALREIYLKGFEICVKEAKPKMIMTAYNIVNGIRASENAELLQGILRGEWGFDGMIASDWWTHGIHCKEVKAGNDIKMPHGFPEELKEAVESGELSREELCECVKRILTMILWVE